MEAILNKVYSKDFIKSSVFNLLGIAFIYFVPAISHLLALPVYFIEPMRLILILSIAHTSKSNAFIIAASLPLFSFFISSHPVFLKSLLIMGELMLNVWLFFFLAEKLKNKFASMLISIALSKIFYYSIKLALLNSLLLNGNLVSTPVYIQLITMTFFSLYFLRKEKK